MQHGDPLGPSLLSPFTKCYLPLMRTDDKCLDLLFQAWFLDDVVLAGKKASVLRALPIQEEYGPSLGIFANLSKCELFIN